MSAPADRWQQLHGAAVAVNASLDLDPVLEALLTQALDLLAAQRGSVMLLDPSRHHLVIAKARGLAPAVIAGTRLALGEGIAGTVAALGAPRRLAAGVRRPEGRNLPLPAALTVPLLAGEELIGVLNVAAPVAGGDFGDETLELAQLLATQGALALRNAQTYAEQTRFAAESRALHEISLTLNKSLDLHSTLQQVLDTASALLGAQRGSILLRSPHEPVLTIAVAHGLSAEVIAGTRVAVGDGIAGEVALTGRPRNLPAGKASGSVKQGEPPAAALCVPLQVGGATIGVLNLSARADRADFGEHDLETLLAFGAQAALAISNARLYDTLRSRAAALAALNDISRALSGSLDRDEVLQRVLDNALGLLDCRKGSLMLLEADPLEERYDARSPLNQAAHPPRRHLTIVVARGLPPEVIATTRIPPGEGIAGRVALTGEVEVMAQGEVDLRSRSGQRSASLCLPLMAKERVIGVLNLSEHDGGDFSEEEVALAITLAAQAAASIENAQLYDDLQDQFVHSIRVIANAIDARDPYTRGHSERVAEYARLIAEELGLDDAEIEQIYHAGLLHDVGKIGIRDSILLKDGRLTADEFEVMKLHPVISAEILYPVKQLRGILPGLRHHHEQFGAHGYPDGLRADAIPLQARVIGVADTYDAMTTDRPYRRALPRRTALLELLRHSGTQFDPSCVEAFLARVCAGQVAPLDGQPGDGAAEVTSVRAEVAALLQEAQP